MRVIVHYCGQICVCMDKLNVNNIHCAPLHQYIYILFYVTAVHVEDIIFHMFQYIQKLRTEGPQEWVFEECKVINFVYSSTTFQTGGGGDKL